MAGSIKGVGFIFELWTATVTRSSRISRVFSQDSWPSYIKSECTDVLAEFKTQGRDRFYKGRRLFFEFRTATVTRSSRISRVFSQKILFLELNLCEIFGMYWIGLAAWPNTAWMTDAATHNSKTLGSPVDQDEVNNRGPIPFLIFSRQKLAKWTRYVSKTPKWDIFPDFLCKRICDRIIGLLL